MVFWQRFINGHPRYLARHYWWAYLWGAGVWFFDHQPIINAILFGQYKKLSDCALRMIKRDPPQGRFLQLTCVYGELTTKLLESTEQDIFLADVANVQLQLALSKARNGDKNRLLATRLNAESLAYCDNAFATILVFFLFHELPVQARKHTMQEILRTLQPGGCLVVTEYAAEPRQHLLWKFPLSRVILTRLEPFLEAFWQEDLLGMLQQCGQMYGKRVVLVEEQHFFNRFYRVTKFEVSEFGDD